MTTAQQDEAIRRTVADLRRIAKRVERRIRIVDTAGVDATPRDGRLFDLSQAVLELADDLEQLLP